MELVGTEAVLETGTEKKCHAVQMRGGNLAVTSPLHGRMGQSKTVSQNMESLRCVVC